MSLGGPTEVGSIYSKIGLDTSDLKRGLDQAKQALSESARMMQDALRFTNDLARGIDKEAESTRRANLLKQQQAALDREMSAAKSRLNAILAGESAAAQQVAAKYSLVDAAQQRNLATIKEQITAQRALQEAQLAAGIAAEKAATSAIAASEKAAAASIAAAEKASAAQLAAAQKNLGRNLTRAGRGLTNYVTTPIVGAALAAGYAGQQVQEAEAGLRSGTGLTGNALAGVEDSFKRIAPQVSQPLKVVADAVAELERRTGETGPALEKLAVSELNLQRITGSGNELFKDSAQVFAAWNVPVEKQVPLLDEVNRAHQQTGISVTKLLESVSKSAPTFQLMGKSVEDSIATFAAFNKVNIAPERLVTALNTAMGKLAKAGVPDVGRAMSDMLQRIQNLKDPTEALSEAVRLFGARGGTQLAAALRAGKLSLDDLLNSIKNGGDTIEKTDKDTQTFSTQWGKMRNAFLIALAPLGEVILKFTQLAMQALKPAIEWLGKLLDAFGKLDPGTQKFILGALAVAAAIGPIIGWAGKLITAFNLLKGAWTAISLVFTEAAAGGGALELIGAGIAALSGPIGIAILAIGALAAAWELNLGDIQQKTKDATAATTESLNRLAPRVAANQSLPTFVGTGDPAADMAAMASMDSMRQAEEQRKMAAGPAVTAKGLASSGFASHMGTGGPLTIPTTVSGPSSSAGGGVPGLSAAERLAMFGKTKLSEAQKEDQRATEQMLKDARELAFLQRGESVDVARLAGEYPHLSAARLEEIVASRKQLDAAVKATESRKTFMKDMDLLNASIRRLKGGQDAEASGVDALKEKFPGLSNAMLQAMNNAIQWKKHLQEARAEMHAVEQGIRSLQAGILESGAGSKMEEAAARLFGPKLLEHGKRPKSAADLFQNYLTPTQQAEAQVDAGTGVFGNIDAQIKEQRTRLFGLYGDRGPIGNPTSVGLRGRAGQVYAQATGPNSEAFLTRADQEAIVQKSAELIKLKDRTDQAAAAQSVYNGEWDKFNTVVGTAQPNLQVLQGQFKGLTSQSRLTREVMQQFGVTLKSLPKATQDALRASSELAKALKFYQDFASGVEGVFQGMFQHLFEHGFKGFFASVIDGFSKMLQKMAADYLSSELANLVMNLIGGALGGGGGGGGGGQVDSGAYRSGYASGGTYSGSHAFWAGERGPELIFPQGGGTVIPHAQSMAMAGGGTTTVHMTVVTQDAASFQAPQNRHAITEGLARELQRAQARRR